MRRSLLLMIFSFLLFPATNSEVEAQTMKEDLEKFGLERYCGTDIVWQKQMNTASPEMAKRMRRAKEKLRAGYKKGQKGKRAGTVYTVPVVFHVIHDEGPEKIDPKRVENAMDILNRDFRKQNGDTSQIVSPFKSIAADVEIEFRLAQKDPDGNCHRGITYTRSDRTYDGDTQMKSLIQWDPSSYMNVWVCNDINNGAAGYTTTPALAEFYPSRDGIVLKYNYLGTQSPSSVYRSRTLTHEVGHYFSLDHPWGTCGNPGDASNCDGSNCNGNSCNSGNGSTDDGICDTPHTVGWTTCNTSGTSCGTKDNVQNYMEYSYCFRMFTQGQRSAMRNAITSSLANRNQLWKSANLQETGVSGGDNLCLAAFRSDKRVVCEGASVQFSDLSYHGPTTWKWNFEGGNANNNNLQDPTVTYSNKGSFDVTLTVENANDTASITKKNYIEVLPDQGKKLPLIDPLDYMVSFQNSFNLFRENVQDDSIAWKPTTQAGEGGSRGSLKLNNHSNIAGNEDIIYTTSLDASQVSGDNLELSFDVAFAKSSSGDQDKLQVYASSDCGKTWNSLKTYSAQFTLPTASVHTDPFVPESDEWEKRTLNNPLSSTYNVQGLRFKFEFRSDEGNNIYIDNINIHDQENVGIKDANDDKSSLQLHPNPVEKGAVLKLGLPQQQEVSIEILDLRGKTVRNFRREKVLSKGSHRFDLDLSDLKAGPYFIKVKMGDKESTKKLFKK